MKHRNGSVLPAAGKVPAESAINQRIVLNSRPVGKPVVENFRQEDLTTSTPEDGQILLRTLYLSLDPYMRGRLSDAPSYAAPVEVGQVIVGGTILTKRLSMKGFIIFDDYGDRYREFFDQMSIWVQQGKVKFREDIVEGLENAPKAFIGLLQGKNFGKLIVRVADESSGAGPTDQTSSKPALEIT